MRLRPSAYRSLTAAAVAAVAVASLTGVAQAGAAQPLAGAATVSSTTATVYGPATGVRSTKSWTKRAKKRSGGARAVTAPTTATPTTSTSTPPAPTGNLTEQPVPMPSRDLTGWRLAFADDFLGTTLDSGKWFAYRGQPGGDPGGWWEPSHAVVKDGRLVLRGSKVDGRWVTAGVATAHRFSQTYGKYEVRYRIAQGTGIGHAALLWPMSNTGVDEIDFSEDNARDRQTAYAFTHYSDAAGVHKQTKHSVAVDLTKWNTMGVEWSPGKVVYTKNGAPWASTEGAHVPSVEMFLAIQSQAWHCEANWQACPDATTPANVDLEVDWVVAYSRA